MSDIITPKTLSGFMELMPAEQLQFEKIKSVLEETYRLYGFVPLDTPVLEASEILLAKAGGETEKQIYRFEKGDSDLTMRFDLTVPLAKYVAMHAGELAFPFRRYQIGKVYRGERAQRGRFREFYQADIDVIGDGALSLSNDAEIPSLINTVFTKLGLDDFTIRLNNRKVLNGFYGMLGLSDKAGDIMRTVDKLDKMGKEKVVEELQTYGLSDAQCDEILAFMAITGSNADVIAALEARCGKNEIYDAGVAELREVIRLIGTFGVPEAHYRIDLSIARGLDYYTGTVYETTMNKHPEIGSICSGGRYDNLAGYYTKRSLPGVGISIGLTRLFFILSDKKYITEGVTAPADLLIAPMVEDMGAVLAVAAQFRAGNVRTQVQFEDGKLKAKLNYANRMNIPYVLFVGEDEINSGNFTLKDMVSGEQTQAPITELIAKITAARAERESRRILNVQ